MGLGGIPAAIGAVTGRRADAEKKRGGGGGEGGGDGGGKDGEEERVGEGAEGGSFCLVRGEAAPTGRFRESSRAHLREGSGQATVSVHTVSVRELRACSRPGPSRLAPGSPPLRAS